MLRLANAREETLQGREEEGWCKLYVLYSIIIKE